MSVRVLCHVVNAVQVQEEMSKSLRRLFLLGISLCDVLISTSCSTLANAHRLISTYVVASLLILITLLVRGSLGLVRSTLLVVQSLPALTEDLADLSYYGASVYVEQQRGRGRSYRR